MISVCFCCGGKCDDNASSPAYISSVESEMYMFNEEGRRATNKGESLSLFLDAYQLDWHVMKLPKQGGNRVSS